MIRYSIILIIIVFLAAGCRKPETYPNIPAISFSSFVTKDTTDLLNHILRGRLSFYLIDGNGDIGLNDYDTIAPWDTGSIYNNVLCLEFFKYENGSYVSDSSGDAAYRIPYLEPQGQNKVLKCTISVDIDFIVDEMNNPVYDSIMFKFYLYDRELNVSNTEGTGLIVLP